MFCHFNLFFLSSYQSINHALLLFSLSTAYLSTLCSVSLNLSSCTYIGISFVPCYISLPFCVYVFLFFKWAKPGPFLFFSHVKYLTLNDKSINGVLGTRTRVGRMVGAYKSTELWRHPLRICWFLHLYFALLSTAFSYKTSFSFRDVFPLFSKQFLLFLTNYSYMGHLGFFFINKQCNYYNK